METLITKSSVMLDGRIIPPGKTLQVPEKDAEALIRSGDACLKEKKETKDDAKLKAEKEAKEKAEKTAAALESVRKMAIEESKKRGGGPSLVFTEETFKALGWEKAREVAEKLYGVKDSSWDGLAKEFMAAQEKALSGKEG